MKFFERVKFQRPDTGEIREAILTWDAGEVQILTAWSEAEGKMIGPLIVEVVQQGEDGIFRRVTDYTLDQQGEDMLRTLRGIATELDKMDKRENQT